MNHFSYLLYKFVLAKLANSCVRVKKECSPKIIEIMNNFRGNMCE